MLANLSETAGKRITEQVIRTKQLLMNTLGQGWVIMNGKSVTISNYQ